MIIRQDDKAFYDKYYKPLVGATIVAYGWTEAGPGEDTDGWFEPMPVFKAVLDSGEYVVLTLSSDPEGNGPGFLFIVNEDHYDQKEEIVSVIM